MTGDPSGTGRGGPGYRIVDEICDDLRFDRAGRVAMYHPVGLLNANGSQFFITYGPVHTSFRYDGEFTIFGQVVEGLDVLEALTPRQRDDLPESFLPHGDKLHTIRIEIAE
jgi:cyclophilin family peptidyl-prolyl cis-trans isomerase